MKKIQVKVKKEFLDKYTGIKHKVDEKLTITDERYREIQRTGDLVEVIPSKQAAEPKKEK